MNRSRQFVVSALVICSSWILAGGCSSSDTGADSPASSAGSAGTGGSAQGGMTFVAPGGTSSGGNVADTLNPLCGVGVMAGTCTPDDATACNGYMPSAGGEGGAGSVEHTGGATGVSSGGAQAGASQAGAPQGGSAGGAPAQGGAAQAGAPGDAGANQGGVSLGGVGGVGTTESGGAGAGGESGAGMNPPDLSHYGCQVARQNNQAIRQCVLAGTGKANAPCFTAADCAPSFACVSEGDAGRCLRYCCKPGTACQDGTYCAERPLLRPAADASNAESPHVPVCVPADNCSLEEAFPCPTKGGCRCPDDTACMVVREDGTTTCVTPGTGQAGDPCPCAWNHVCSSVTHQCVKLCNTDPTKSDCGVQKCQASSELPPNFGVCVGPLK